MHTCSKCKSSKSPDNFTKNSKYRSGLSSYCKSCMKAYYRPEEQKRYERQKRMARLGLTLEEADELLRKHPNCQICGAKPKGRNQRLCIDHCHTTDIIRGVLCTRCNAWIGWLKDDPHLLEQASIYLNEFARSLQTRDTSV